MAVCARAQKSASYARAASRVPRASRFPFESNLLEMHGIPCYPRHPVVVAMTTEAAYSQKGDMHLVVTYFAHLQAEAGWERVGAFCAFVGWYALSLSLLVCDVRADFVAGSVPEYRNLR